jgi:hypothetical protein
MLIPPPCLGLPCILSPLGGVLLVVVVGPLSCRSRSPHCIVSQSNLIIVPVPSLPTMPFSVIAMPSESSPHPYSGTLCCHSIGLARCAPQPCAAINRHPAWQLGSISCHHHHHQWQMTLPHCPSLPPPHMPSSIIPKQPLWGCQRCWSHPECHQHSSCVVHQGQVAECTTTAIATPITTTTTTTASTAANVLTVVVLAAVAVVLQQCHHHRHDRGFLHNPF